MPVEVRIQISNHHVHIARKDLDVLFGEGYELTVKTPLNGPEFAANETVTLIGPKGRIDGVRILGPLRKETQIELLRADNFKLGLDAPIRISGDIAGSAPLTLVGPAGTLDLKEGAIVALRHIHIGAETAAELGLKDGQMVSVKTKGTRGLVFDNTMIRIMPGRAGPLLHVDTEEGNAAELINNISKGELLI